MDRRTLPDQPAAFTPIGVVENDFDERTPAPLIRAEPSRIVLRPDLVEGLTGMEPGQSVLVLFHFDRIDDFDLLQHPRGTTTTPSAASSPFAARAGRIPSARRWWSCSTSTRTY